jgi:hypothetical protein
MTRNRLNEPLKEQSQRSVFNKKEPYLTDVKWIYVNMNEDFQ